MTNKTSSPRFVLVTGATGQQGGAVARALLTSGHRVRGLTRNTDSQASRALADLGAEMVTGDFTHRDSLTAAASGVDTIFLMTTPFESGVDAETEQGLMMIDVVRDAGVGHLVFSSVASADQKTGIPHFDSKFAVEEAIVASGVPYTIIAPVYFMDNAMAPWMLDGLKAGKLSLAMPGDIALQQVATQTIGEFATAIIERRETLFSKRYDFASDELNMEDVVAIISADSENEIIYEGFPPDAMREHSEDLALMFEWFDTTGYIADIDGLKAEFPDVSWPSFAEWSSEQDWKAIGL